MDKVNNIVDLLFVILFLYVDCCGCNIVIVLPYKCLRIVNIPDGVSGGPWIRHPKFIERVKDDCETINRAFSLSSAGTT